MLHELTNQIRSIYSFKSYSIMFSWIPFAFLVPLSIYAIITKGLTAQIAIYPPLSYIPHAEAVLIWSTTFLIYFFPRFKQLTIPLFMLIYGWDELIWNLSYIVARELDGFPTNIVYTGLNSYKLTLVFFTMLLGFHILKKKQIIPITRYTFTYFAGFLIIWLTIYIGYLDAPIVEDIVRNTVTFSNIYYEILWQLPILLIWSTMLKGYTIKNKIS